MTQQDPNLSPNQQVVPKTYTDYTLTGNLVFDYGLPAANLTVRLYNVGFAGQDVQLAETCSDGQGNYSFSYQLSRGQMPSLQLRVVYANNNDATISTTKFSGEYKQLLTGLMKHKEGNCVSVDLMNTSIMSHNALSKVKLTNAIPRFIRYQNNIRLFGKVRGIGPFSVTLNVGQQGQISVTELGQFLSFPAISRIAQYSYPK